MTTGEKIALLRKQKSMTQEELAEVLNISRQSVSRWEMDVAFPETDKLIRISKLFECSIDFLLNNTVKENTDVQGSISIDDCYKFIRECGYFFLATSIDSRPSLRPLGMIYSNNKNLFFATDKRKTLYSDLQNNSQIEIATYNSHSHKWIRIHGIAEQENSIHIKEEISKAYPLLKQNYHDDEDEIYLAIFKISINNVEIN